MENLWGSDVWGAFCVFAVLLGSLLIGNIIQKSISILKNSLIPTSVISGLILIIIAAIYKAVTGNVMFDTAFFGGKGTQILEVITYHSLALGFIASTLKNNNRKINKKRTREIFNTGVTTVSTYLIQGIIGLIITVIGSKYVKGLLEGSGVLLAFGYGQGTGQALNYGTIFESDYGFVGGKSFGLTIAALGFLSASIGGVIYLNIMKAKGKLKLADKQAYRTEKLLDSSENDISFTESLDKITIQISLIAVTYFIAYSIMKFLGNLLPGMRSLIFGFNFLIGVLMAILVKNIFKFVKTKTGYKTNYIDNFLLTRSGNFCFDLMIVSGIAAIRLDMLENYWGIIIILGFIGSVITLIYNRFVAKKLFPDYSEEQFLMMYGMLTGTASTGTILLREADGEFETPALENMVYQNLPAIAFGFPMMILANLSAKMPLISLVIFAAYLVVINIILFRKQIFKKRTKNKDK